MKNVMGKGGLLLFAQHRLGGKTGLQDVVFFLVKTPFSPIHLS
jgi:hypothetical protein